MQGARSGGLQEFNSVRFEARQTDFIAPDTTAGETEANLMLECYKELFFKRPPNKRTNYAKFSIASPFSCNWKKLVQEWSEQETPRFSVLRDKSVLQDLKVF